MKLEVILSPQELPALARRDLRDTACVVFDVLRATSTIVTALHNGARAVVPVAEIADALELRRQHPDVLLGGERDGLKIHAGQTGGIDFDLGNSPREYTPEKVAGRTIVSTTTNGTRALRACAGAQTVMAASFLNLSVTARFVRELELAALVLVCAGTRENMALEDVFAAGALCDLLIQWDVAAGRAKTDSAETALTAWRKAKSDLPAAAAEAENARRLLANAELRDDVAFCLQPDKCPVIARMAAGAVIEMPC